MLWLVLLPVGAAIGAGVGYAIEKVRLAPVLRLVAAGVGGMVVAAASLTGVVYIRLRLRGDFIFGIGFEERAALWIVVGMAALIGTCAVLHWVVASAAAFVGRPIRYPAMVVGCAAGLAGAVPPAWAMVGLSDILVR